MSEEKGGMEGGERTPVLVGIRHHSPVGARFIWELLREWWPAYVLIEAPADFESLIDRPTDSELKPSFTVMAYMTEASVRSILYPFAIYSPEYRVLLATREFGIPVVFCDLPLFYILDLQGAVERYLDRKRDEVAEKRVESATELDDMEGFWERYLEQSPTLENYLERSRIFGEEVWAAMSGKRFEQARNTVREAYMRRVITEEVAAGISVDCLVVLTGAFRTPALFAGELLDGAALQKPPQHKAELTLIPYLYRHLSSHSGYAAGNLAPACYELFWEALAAKKPENHAARCLSVLAVHIRERGGLVSSAEVLEAALFAGSLTRLREGVYPTHGGLEDAAVTCLGHGSLGGIAEGIALTDIDTKIGHMPIGGLLASIQRGFADQCAGLKLNFGPVAEKLRLDLYEDHRARNEKSAFLQLRRSFFLQRLHLLDIDFAAL